ncbi:MAG: thiamine pyrophosphate-binding protein [Rhodospirillaceae bacterium]|nr:thiamine pyrophosphate-binding protein [Rhodospirillaceae bacterium]
MPAIVHDKGPLAGDNIRLSGGQLVARALKQHGIETVFGLAGTTHAHILEAMDEDGFKIVPGRSENGTVGAADGYARVTGKCGVALVIADQGVVNAMAAIATAYHACSPVLIIVGWYAGPLGVETEADIDNEKIPFVESVSKWTRTVPHISRVGEFVHAALKRATGGRKGPVVLQITSAMMAETIEAVNVIDVPATALPAPAPDPAQFAKAVEALANAKRPLILAGGGAHWSGCGPSLRKLAQRFNIPVLGNALGRGLVPEDNRLGYCLHLASPVLAEADAILVLGARLKGRLGFGLAPQYRKDATFIQVDVAPEELGRNRHIQIPIVADARTFIESLDQALAARGHKPLPGEPWTLAVLKDRLAHIDTKGRATGAPVHPYWIGREVMARMGEDALLVMDGAQVLSYVYATVRVKAGPVLDHYPLGSMGSCTPLMVGACAGLKERAKETGGKSRRVVMITGDGAFGYFCNEIGSAKMAGFNPIVVVANDSAWGVEWAGHMEKLGRAINTELNPTRFDLIARAHGCLGIRVERPDQLGPALDAAFAADVPCVIDVITDREAAFEYRKDPMMQMLGRFKGLSESRKFTYGQES